VEALPEVGHKKFTIFYDEDVEFSSFRDYDHMVIVPPLYPRQAAFVQYNPCVNKELLYAKFYDFE
jgi:hypothetical protein